MSTNRTMKATGVDWLGSVPANWDIAPLGHYFTERKVTVSDTDYQPLSVTKAGIVPQREDVAKTDAGDNRRLVMIGDFAINSRSDRKGSSGISDYTGSVSVITIVITPRGLLPGFAHHLLRSVAFQEEFYRWGSGIVADLWSTRWSEMKRITLAVPPWHEQVQIADYLDRETAEIDAFIADQERLIELLNERRIGVIDMAFSGMETNSRIVHACIDIVDCLHATPEVDDNGEYEAVRTASVRNGLYRPGFGLLVNKNTWLERNVGGSPSVGDIIFAREGGSAGEAAMVPSSEICLGQRMVLLRVNPSSCIGEFLLWQMYSSRVQNSFRISMSGSAAPNIRLPELRTMPIWLPPLDVQREVMEYIGDALSKIDVLISESERLIALSRERRSALITAAVTGQIEVPS